MRFAQYVSPRVQRWSARPAHALSMRRAVSAGVAMAVGTVALGLLAGCETKSFIDPAELGRYQHQPLTIKIMNTVDPRMEEPNVEFAGSAEPVAADLVPSTADYAVSKNDLLTIEISDLSGPGINTVKTSRVSESGNISLPFVGLIHAEGLTEAELEQRIVDEYRNKGIVQKATVSVTVTEARGRAFSILGAVARPGQYAIFEPDFRVLDALVVAGDQASPLLEDIYIVRRTPVKTGNPTTTPAPGGAQPSPNGAQPSAPSGGPQTEPPSLAPRGMLSPRVPAAALSSTLASNTVHVLHLAADQPTDLTPTANQPAPAPTAAPGGAQGRYIMVDGKPFYVGPATEPTTGDVAAPAGGATTAAPLAPAAPESTSPAAPAPAAAPPVETEPNDLQPRTAANGENTAGAGAGATTQPGFTFNQPTSTENVRVIHIPLNRLRNGELQYNIVIKPKDTIIVQNLPIGEYYMGGHVARPGAYTLTQRRITLKQAVISAGMFDQLAIPERTDIIRRIREPGRGDLNGAEVFVRVNLAKIFAGQAADIFLKPNDQVMVGTNAIAPFLAALRGAFRITYGFGFLYDRNYAVSQQQQSF